MDNDGSHPLTNFEGFEKFLVENQKTNPMVTKSALKLRSVIDFERKKHVASHKAVANRRVVVDQKP